MFRVTTKLGTSRFPLEVTCLKARPPEVRRFNY